MPLHHHHHHLFLLLLLLVSPADLAAALSFPAKYHPFWGSDNIAVSNDGNVILTLDRKSGAGFISSSSYTSGFFSARMKLVPGDSAGTVSTFYLSSLGDNRSELDLEFLGNSSGLPYTLQTNIFVDGVGRREQGIRLWFDPTADFHDYAILWNRHLVMFLVDRTVIRVHRNLPGVPFPGDKAMWAIGSLWNGEDWATQGGRVKINWSHAPFIASFGRLTISGAPPDLADLTETQKQQLRWVKAKWSIYDYCDQSRGSSIEC